MKPNDFVIYDLGMAGCEALTFGDTYTLDNLVSIDRVSLKEVPGTFPVAAFSEAKCDHRFRCINSRAREGYRYRVHKCEKCERRKTTVEVEIPRPGPGPTYERYRVRLMELLSDEQCKRLVEFFECWSSKA